MDGDADVKPSILYLSWKEMCSSQQRCGSEDAGYQQQMERAVIGFSTAEPGAVGKSWNPNERG